MLRTGQMILCQALKRHVLFESFSLETLQSQFARQKYREILRTFADNDPKAPFGVHRIVREGAQNGLEPGQWFGPQFISIMLRNLCNRLQPFPDFKILVCLDGNIFLDELRAEVKQRKSVLVLLPIRLGLTSIHRAYLEQVKRHFQISANVGIAGGKDHAALYLIGDENASSVRGSFLYLDPHTIQPSLPSALLNEPNAFPDLPSYHCTEARSLDPEALCTSMAPGFYLRDEAAFESWA